MCPCVPGVSVCTCECECKCLCAQINATVSRCVNKCTHTNVATWYSGQPLLPLPLPLSHMHTNPRVCTWTICQNIKGLHAYKAESCKKLIKFSNNTADVVAAWYIPWHTFLLIPKCCYILATSCKDKSPNCCIIDLHAACLAQFNEY